MSTPFPTGLGMADGELGLTHPRPEPVFPRGLLVGTLLVQATWVEVLVKRFFEN